MIQKTSSALSILERAMNIEQEGLKFYRGAAQAAQDKKGQETFTILANDELIHYNLIKSQYNDLKRNGRWVASPEVQTVKIDLTKPLFPKGIDVLKNKVTDKSSDWDALLFGLDIEIKSYDLYRKAAAEVTDVSGKTMLEFLAEQETGHFNMLMMWYDSLYGPVSWWD